MKAWQLYISLVFFFALLGITDGSEASSPVILISDMSSVDVMEGEYVVATLTVTNTDNSFRQMEVKLTAHFPGGISWTTMFLDTDGNPIDGDIVTLGKQDSTTVKLVIFCDDVCSAGDTNTVQVLGQTDPIFYPSSSNDTDSCGSTDCVNDTSPASNSLNLTNTIGLNLAAFTDYKFELSFDSNSSTKVKDQSMITTFSWNYSIINQGYYSDNFNISLNILNEFDSNVTDDYFSISSPNSNGTFIPGLSISNGSNFFQGKVNFFVINATSGNYTFNLTVMSQAGNQSSHAEASVIVEFFVEVNDGKIVNETEDEVLGWEGTGYTCTYTNETFCTEIRPYCAEGVTKEDGRTCASMVDSYCANPNIDDTGCDSENSDNSLTDCYDITGENKNDEFAQGYCGFFTEESSETEIPISSGTILAIISAIILILSYFLLRKEPKN